MSDAVDSPEFAQVRAQLAALDAGDKKRRRQFRRLELLCQGCKGLVAEVMETHPVPVLLVRWRQRDEHGHVRAPGRDEWTGLLLGDDHPTPGLIDAACRCGHHWIRPDVIVGQRGTMTSKPQRPVEGSTQETMRILRKAGIPTRRDPDRSRTGPTLEELHQRNAER